MKNFSNFTNDQNLLPIITDIFNVLILPPICFAGILLSLFCIIVTNKFKNNIVFFFIKINAVSDLSFLTINFFIGIIRCGSICPLDTTYEAKFYEKYIYLFIGSSFLMVSSLIEILIILVQYLTICKINLFEKINKYFILLIFLLLSIILNSPIMIIRKIDKAISPENEEIFTLQLNEYGKTESGRILSIIYGLIRGAFLFILLFISNCMLTYEYRKYLKSKKKIHFAPKSTLASRHQSKIGTRSDETVQTSSKIAKLNTKMSSMLISMSVYFLISHLPFSAAPILFALNVNKTFYNGFLIFANFVLFVSHGFTFFIFFFFNRKIREQTYLLFKKNN